MGQEIVDEDGYNGTRYKEIQINLMMAEYKSGMVYIFGSHPFHLSSLRIVRNEREILSYDNCTPTTLRTN